MSRGGRLPPVLSGRRRLGTRPFAASRRRILEFVLLAPDQLVTPDVDDIAILDAEPIELGGDAARLQKPIEALLAFVPGKVRHHRESFDTDSGHGKVVCRDALGLPGSLVHVLERVATTLLGFFDLDFPLHRLSQRGCDGLHEHLHTLTRGR